MRGGKGRKLHTAENEIEISQRCRAVERDEEERRENRRCIINTNNLREMKSIVLTVRDVLIMYVPYVLHCTATLYCITPYVQVPIGLVAWHRKTRPARPSPVAEPLAEHRTVISAN
jgi:hypothetical protein